MTEPLTELEKWHVLIHDWDGLTWDHVVECQDGLPKEFAEKICELGYYGRLIRREHGLALTEGRRFEAPNQYGITYHGVDGKEEKWFKTLEEASKYILPRIQWTQSDTEVCTDYANYYLTGFTLADIGVNWREKLP